MIYVSLSLESIKGSVWKPKYSSIVSYSYHPGKLADEQNTLFSQEHWYTVVEVSKHLNHIYLKMLGTDGSEHYRSFGDRVEWTPRGCVLIGVSWFDELNRLFIRSS